MCPVHFAAFLTLPACLLLWCASSAAVLCTCAGEPAAPKLPPPPPQGLERWSSAAGLYAPLLASVCVLGCTAPPGAGEHLLGHDGGAQVGEGVQASADGQQATLRALVAGQGVPLGPAGCTWVHSMRSWGVWLHAAWYTEVHRGMHTRDWPLPLGPSMQAGVSPQSAHQGDPSLDQTCR